jgi:hypothetical protein
LFSALWGVLNSIFSPIVFRIFGLPILCDMIGFAVLSLTVWWVRKPGAATMVGLVATIINFIFNPGGVFFLGFTAASIVFDSAAFLLSFYRSFRKTSLTLILLLCVSVLSATVAGLIIGTYFMASPALASWGGVLGWAGLHALGGIIGGIIGVAAIAGLVSRGVPVMEAER